MISNTKERLMQLKQEVLEANLQLPASGLVKLTWGNVSAIDRQTELIVIKPSGIPYNRLTIGDLVITGLDGNVLEGTLAPSSDLATHIVLYKNFSKIGSVVHTHSKNAVAWAQSGRDIPAYGTTHADTFFGNIPCTRELTKEEIERAYEIETGNVIVKTFSELQLDENAIPGVIVHSHGPFTWGRDAKTAVQNSVILEEVADMAIQTELLTLNRKTISQDLLNKHYYRKHGENAYYGQK